MIDTATLHLKCDELVLAVKVLMQARRQFTESNDLIGQAKALLKFGVLKCENANYVKPVHPLKLQIKSTTKNKT